MSKNASFGFLSRRFAVCLACGAAVVIGLPTPGFAPPGDLDPTFDGDGKVTTEFNTADRVVEHARDVAIQTDGKIVAVGATFELGSSDFGLVRYNPDGSGDGSFGGQDGTITTGFGSTDQANSVGIQTDGKIVAGGLARVSANDKFALARYNPNGSLDTTFDGDGKVTTDFALGSQEQATGIAILPDGKIIAAGFSNASGSSDFAVARFNSDGSLDASFGEGDGRVTTEFSVNDFSQGYDVGIQGDGKILVAGTHVPSGTLDYDFALARYDTDGSLDSTFGGDGRVTTDLFPGSRDQVRSLSIQADGKIVAAGCVFCIGQPGTAFALARYEADGTLDSTFDGDGKVTTSFSSPPTESFDTVIQADGKIVVVGCVFCGTEDSDFVVARYGTDGSLDTTFGGNGAVTTDIAFGRDDAVALVIQSDGKIVVAGCAFCNTDFSDFGLARYKVDPGAADLSLTKAGPSGRVPTGSSMTYTLEVSNNGPDWASEVTINDQLPPSVSFVSADPSQGECGQASATVTCTVGVMASGGVATIDIVVRPTSAGRITNTASVSAFTVDSNETNNTDSVETSVCRITSRRSSIPCP